jgi:hypothetical protein
MTTVDFFTGVTFLAMFIVFVAFVVEGYLAKVCKLEEATEHDHLSTGRGALAKQSPLLREVDATSPESFIDHLKRNITVYKYLRPLLKLFDTGFPFVVMFITAIVGFISAIVLANLSLGFDKLIGFGLAVFVFLGVAGAGYLTGLWLNPDRYAVRKASMIKQALSKEKRQFSDVGVGDYFKRQISNVAKREDVFGELASLFSKCLRMYHDNELRVFLAVTEIKDKHVTSYNLRVLSSYLEIVSDSLDTEVAEIVRWESFKDVPVEELQNDFAFLMPKTTAAVDAKIESVNLRTAFLSRLNEVATDIAQRLVANEKTFLAKFPISDNTRVIDDITGDKRYKTLGYFKDIKAKFGSFFKRHDIELDVFTLSVSINSFSYNDIGFINSNGMVSLSGDKLQKTLTTLFFNELAVFDNDEDYWLKDLTDYDLIEDMYNQALSVFSNYDRYKVKLISDTIVDTDQLLPVTLFNFEVSRRLVKVMAKTGWQINDLLSEFDHAKTFHVVDQKLISFNYLVFAAAVSPISEIEYLTDDVVPSFIAALLERELEAILDLAELSFKHRKVTSDAV